MSWVEHYVHPGMVAVDVGANRGLYTEQFLGRGAIVIAVEPHAEMAQYLRERYPTVRVIEAAMTDHEGTVIFHYSKASEHGSVCKANLLDDIEQAREVSAMTLDSLGPVDVVKVDVQGAEAAILVGATRTLRETRPIWYIELWQEGLTHAGASVGAVCDVFEAHGYVPIGQSWAEVREQGGRQSGHSSIDALLQPKEKAA